MRIDKSKFFFFEDLSGLYTADFEVNGGSVNDEVILTNAKADVVLDIYKQLSINFPHYVSSENIGNFVEKILIFIHSAFRKLIISLNFRLKSLKF